MEEGDHHEEIYQTELLQLFSEEDEVYFCQLIWPLIIMCRIFSFFFNEFFWSGEGVFREIR